MHSWVKTIYPGLMKCKQCHCLRAEIDGEFKPKIHFDRLSEEVYAYSHNGYWAHRPNLGVKFMIDWVPKHASCVTRRSGLDDYAGPDPSIPEIQEVGHTSLDSLVMDQTVTIGIVNSADWVLS